MILLIVSLVYRETKSGYGKCVDQGLLTLVWTNNDNNNNKKHSENADTSTSDTFDMWCWPYDKVKNAEVI